MVTLDSTTTTIRALDHESVFGQAQVAAAAFLARYRGRTLDAYRHDLRTFFQWASDVDLEVLAATRPHIELYRTTLEDRGLAASTIDRRLSTVCGFYRFAHIDGRIASNPAQHVRRPTVHRREGHGLDRGELGRFLFTAEQFDHDHTALAVLLGLNGLRVSEACTTNVEDLGFERGHRILTAQKNGTTFPQPEASQRSRSFLFLSMASVAAAVGGTPDVFINENGIMAIHLPMTAARAGSLSTHTASPSILERLQLTLADVLGAPIVIHNNLLSNTKPEVVDIGRAIGAETELANTVSCWSIGRTGRHCGSCAPCLMRRISFELHGVPDVAYESDAFDDPDILENDFACDNLTHLVRIVRDLEAKSDLDLQLEYPELLNGGSRLTLTETLDMHRRWAHEASQILWNHPVPAGM